VQLAAGATKKRDLSVLSRPICHELVETVGETVNVAIHEVISTGQVIGSATVTTLNWVGQRTDKVSLICDPICGADLWLM